MIDKMKAKHFDTIETISSVPNGARCNFPSWKRLVTVLLFLHIRSHYPGVNIIFLCNQLRHLLGAANGRKLYIQNSRENSDCKFYIFLRAIKTKDRHGRL